MNGKAILLTGGTGSFGQEFTRIILNEYNPKFIRIFSRGELLQKEMAEKFNDSRLQFVIGDVRDRKTTQKATQDIDIIVHAAALKQIPQGEINPLEFVYTNILGTNNIIDSALLNNVNKTILISSDKAVKPVNLYGATKMVAEKLFIQANMYPSTSKFSCIRYGNVIGSRGSIIPKILESAGTINLTDKRMTRFWITLEQGVHFVVMCLDKMQGGEIFVPKIPSMSIADLIEAISPKAKVKIIGIRPGEKLHEELISTEETRHTKELGNYYIIEPELPFWKGIKGKPFAEKYDSKTNSYKLTRDDITKMVEKLC